MAVYPYGYAGATVTEAQLATKTTWQRLHPEVRRRFTALMREAATVGVSLGVGTGWRKQTTNPDGTCRDGFACPGNSYHEGFMPGGMTRPDGVNDRNAMAIDTVLSSAWPWMNANCGRFGFTHFANVGNEPWHIQPVEISRSRNYATHEPPLRVWPLPDGIGEPEEDFMTPEDKAYLEAKFAAVAGGVWAFKLDHPTAGAPNLAASAFMYYILRNCGDLYEGDAPGSPLSQAEATAVVAELRAAISGINVDDVEAALTAAVTAAVTAALEDATINADLSAADIAKIAQASAAATVAEIAS